MTHIEELIEMNKLLKDLIERKDLSEKMYDLKYMKDIIKDLKDEDFEVKLVLTDEAADLFNSLFGDTETEKKKSDEDIKKEIKEKAQEVIAAKEKEKTDDEYIIHLSFSELKALYKIFFGNFSSILKSPKLRKAITSMAFKVHKTYTNAT